MNSRLKGFTAHYAICQKFNQRRRCLVHIKTGRSASYEYTESDFIWIERPEDEYGIDRAIAADPTLAILYREDWLGGVVIDNEKHRTKQFDVGDKVRVLKQWMREIDQLPMVKGVWIDELHQLSQDEFRRLYLNEPEPDDSNE